MSFACGRCGHAFTRKLALQNHLRKEYACECTLSNTDRKVLLQNLEKQYTDDAVCCKWCNKKFNHSSNMYAHQKICKKQPKQDQKKKENKPNVERSTVINNTTVNKYEVSLNTQDEIQKETLKILINESLKDSKNKSKEDTGKMGHFYIVQEREHILLNKQVYKIGRSANIIVRYNKYPKDSKLLFTILVDNQIEAETKARQCLSSNPNIIHRTDIGIEYFEGDLDYIIDSLYSIIKPYHIECRTYFKQDLCTDDTSELL
jgi:hypothetical protein